MRPKRIEHGTLGKTFLGSKGRKQREDKRKGEFEEDDGNPEEELRGRTKSKKGRFFRNVGFEPRFKEKFEKTWERRRWDGT